MTKTVGRSQAKLRRTLTLLDKLYGSPPRRLKAEVMVDRSLKSGFRFSADSCLAQDIRGSIWVGKPQELWVYVRAVAEAYRACGGGLDQSFDDGMAEAVNQMVLQWVGVKAPWRMERVHYQVVNRPGIGGGKEYRTDTFAALVRGTRRLTWRANGYPGSGRIGTGISAKDMVDAGLLRVTSSTGSFPSV